MVTVRYIVAPLLALLALLLSGCVSPPLTPQAMREQAKDPNGYVKIETFVVNRPYAQVTQYIKRKSNECLNKSFQISITQKCGFASTCENAAGTTKYIPVSTITPTHAEFYTKFWDSESRAVNTPAGDKFIFYLADITPKGGGTSIKLHYFEAERYQWGRDVIKAWAKGENPGCPILNGMY